MLRARVNHEATGTTPVYSPIHGLITCISILDSTFLESNPIRRQQFFNARQCEGQTVIEFREELFSLIEEAGRDNIGVNNLICMMLQIGVSNPALQRELGSIKNPTLPAFSDKLEGYEQARKTVAQSAFGLAATKGNQPSLPPSSGPSNSPQRSTPARGHGEWDRHLALRGKCFRCAQFDHMLPRCSYPASVKCNTCANVGLHATNGKMQAWLSNPLYFLLLSSLP